MAGDAQQLAALLRAIERHASIAEWIDHGAPRGLSTAQWLGIFVTYMLLSGEDLPLIGQIFALLGVYVALCVLVGLLLCCLPASAWLFRRRQRQKSRALASSSAHDTARGSSDLPAYTASLPRADLLAVFPLFT